MSSLLSATRALAFYSMKYLLAAINLVLVEREEGEGPEKVAGSPIRASVTFWAPRNDFRPLRLVSL